ncbi:MAG: nucleotidyltransferase family protein [Desulfomonilaceae bacterium]
MSNVSFEFVTFILAGGLGKRLRPVVADRPKPMADVQGQPFLEILVRLLASKGIRKFVMLVGYKADSIEKYFGNHRFDNLEIKFSHENEPLGTGGAVKNAERFATDPTLLVNGDTYLDVQLHELYKFHVNKNAQVTISMFRTPDVSRYGSVSVGRDGKVTKFHEKHSTLAKSGLINAGVSLVSKSFIKELPANCKFSMETDIFPKIVSGQKMFGLEQNGPFFDIGTPESYREFQDFAHDAQVLNTNSLQTSLT